MAWEASPSSPCSRPGSPSRSLPSAPPHCSPPASPSPSSAPNGRAERVRTRPCRRPRPEGRARRGRLGRRDRRGRRLALKLTNHFYILAKVDNDWPVVTPRSAV
ncbi:hypothetical protein SBRY_40150 [Actinacidiphila bryophytorum]|uniref:Uncharacterized protein n=1 Tax=Actinacidiphila bryophytorum TaxID=1436133 RepID=A0A9W4H2B8_9ACTN|nr:hypothetical protein SBRY_40150 [Actinacidiphila bryophytorum]